MEVPECDMCRKAFRSYQGLGSHKHHCPKRPIAGPPNVAPIDHRQKRAGDEGMMEQLLPPSPEAVRVSSQELLRVCKTILLTQEQFEVIPESAACWEGLSPFFVGVVSPEHYLGDSTLWNHCLMGLEKDVILSVEQESGFCLRRLLPPTDEPLGWNYKYY
jgi:hypothetical protein